MTLTGHIVNGKVVFDGTAPWPDGTLVKVERLPVPAASNGDDRVSLLEKLGAVIGQAEGLPEDAAQYVDHYLYRQPKE
jgi:hypothetical protein